MNNLTTLRPKISEKTYFLSENGNTFTFEVESSVNKHDIARAIADQYKVKVVNVRLASIPGKKKRSIRRSGRNVFYGQRSNVRKAYVTLAEGDKLPIFSAIEEANAPSEGDK